MNLPEWWEGYYPDSEFVVMDLLQPFLDLCSSDSGDSITADTYIPANYGDMLPYVYVFRGGGAASSEAFMDPGAVQVGVIANTRADAWQLINFFRAIMATYRDGGSVRREDGSFTAVTSITEMKGPQQVPEVNKAHKLVPVTFRVECRPPRGLPNYKQIRESIHS